MTSRQAIYERQADRFLARLAECGNFMTACRLVVGPDKAQGLRIHVAHRERTDHEFAERVREALASYVDRLEAEADRRGVEGVERLKFQKGEALVDPRTGEPYTEREYSDRLLIERLRALAPARYARRSISTRIDMRAYVIKMLADIGTVIRADDARYLDDDEIRTLRTIIRKIEQGRAKNPYDSWHRQIETIEGSATEVVNDGKAADES